MKARAEKVGVFDIPKTCAGRDCENTEIATVSFALIGDLPIAKFLCETCSDKKQAAEKGHLH